MVDLPLNGRNLVQLQATLPGEVAGSDRFGDQPNFATSGSRSQANDFRVNGTDANDITLNTPLIIPNPDAIAEVQVISNTINPEYGRNGGAILNATTKSGTNQFHGDGFEFYRDTSLNTRNFFLPDATVFHQNQFGGTIGGPIRKDKAFFFFSYQGTRNQFGVQYGVNGIDKHFALRADFEGHVAGRVTGRRDCTDARHNLCFVVYQVKPLPDGWAACRQHIEAAIA